MPRNEPVPPGPFVGVGGMVVVAFLYGYVAIAAPNAVTSVGLPLVWLGLFVLACRWFTRRPVAVMALPVIALLAWFGGLLLPQLL